MKEQSYLKIINETLSDNTFLGDDCAFLNPSVIGNNGLFITQDTLVEDVHFSLSTTGALELAKKAVNVNLSDLAAVCCKPLFLTISLSLPVYLDNCFVEEFYKGINDVCENVCVKVVGGDITGSDKVVISICAVGQKIFDLDISRKYAKLGDVVATTGFHGDSAAGLKQLIMGIKNTELTKAHLLPQAQIEKAFELAKTSRMNGMNKFAMMDTSDGLGDALYKISKDSNVSIECDFCDIPVSDSLKKEFPKNFEDYVLWGGEDFQLLFCVPHETFEKLDKTKFHKIGVVKEKKDDFFVKIIFDKNELLINKELFEEKSFNHFKTEG